jgi:hypothetical protein
VGREPEAGGRTSHIQDGDLNNSGLAKAHGHGAPARSGCGRTPPWLTSRWAAEPSGSRLRHRGNGNPQLFARASPRRTAFSSVTGRSVLVSWTNNHLPPPPPPPASSPAGSNQLQHRCNARCWLVCFATRRRHQCHGHVPCAGQLEYTVIDPGALPPNAVSTHILVLAPTANFPSRSIRRWQAPGISSSARTGGWSVAALEHRAPLALSASGKPWITEAEPGPLHLIQYGPLAIVVHLTR